MWGCVESIEVLIECGANVNAQNEIGKMTPLHCAIRGTFQSFKQTHQQRLQCVTLLLEAGADSKICDLRGKDALDSIDDAIDETKERNLDLDIVPEMMEMKEVLRRGALGSSPLALSIDSLNVNEVREYLNDEDSSKDDDKAALQKEKNKCLLAVAEKFNAFVEEADKFQEFIDENSSTDNSAYNKLKDICHLLLQAGADPNFHMVADSSDEMKGAPLHIISSAVCSASEDTAQAEIASMMVANLLESGATMSSCTMELLPTAAQRRKLFAIQFLLKHGVDPNVQGRQGMTALIFASRTGRKEIVECLLENDALDLNITDNAGKKAIDYATANNKEEVIALLLKKS